MNRAAFDDLTLDASATEEDEADDGGAAQEAQEEEKVAEESEEEEAFVYDRALYDADGLEDEDVDFDDD